MKNNRLCERHLLEFEGFDLAKEIKVKIHNLKRLGQTGSFHWRFRGTPTQSGSLVPVMFPLNLTTRGRRGSGITPVPTV